MLASGRRGLLAIDDRLHELICELETVRFSVAVITVLQYLLDWAVFGMVMDTSRRIVVAY